MSDIDRLYVAATERTWPQIWGAFAAMMLQTGVMFGAVAALGYDLITDGAVMNMAWYGIVGASAFTGLHGWRLFFNADMRRMRRERADGCCCWLGEP